MFIFYLYFPTYIKYFQIITIKIPKNYLILLIKNKTTLWFIHIPNSIHTLDRIQKVKIFNYLEKII